MVDVLLYARPRSWEDMHNGACVIGTPTRPLNAGPDDEMPTASEPRKLLSLSSGETCDFSSLVELARYRAFCQPGDKAYVYLKDGEVEAGTMTYKTLDQRARAAIPGLP